MSTRSSPQITPVAAPLELAALVIRLEPLKHKMTDDEFFEFCVCNKELRIEMTKEGEMIIMMPTGSEGGHRNYLLTVRFGAWAEADGTDIGFDSSAEFKLPDGAKRAPALSWILRKRWEAIPPKKRKNLRRSARTSSSNCAPKRTSWKW